MTREEGWKLKKGGREGWKERGKENVKNVKEGREI